MKRVGAFIIKQLTSTGFVFAVHEDGREQNAMTYVMSDIHGNAARFQSVMKQIGLRPEDTLYVLGDVIDRYPDGIRILRQLMRMPNVKLLLGNHEYMMLNALDGPGEKDPGYPRALRLWYRNGGGVTHAYLKRLRKSVRREIFDYLRALPLNIDIEVNGQPYLLVHGGVLDRFCEHTDRYDDPVHYAVWYRMERTEPELAGKTILFGHTHTSRYQNKNPLEIWRSPDGGKIGIDCGCGFPPHSPGAAAVYGRLACLRLEDGRVFYSEEALPEQAAPLA